MLIECTICNASFPTDQDIDKEHVEVANSKDVLGEVPVSVSPSASGQSWWMHRKVAAINSATAVLEEGIELGVAADVLGNDAVTW